MSAPRVKRPFAGAASDPAQRQITSFFSATPSSLPGNHVVRSDRLSQATAPALPAPVQSNLLSVGMRVRKSVPEGYKTGTYGSFSLWSDEKPCQPATAAAAAREVRAAARSAHAAAYRELLPFCGIHSVGGMSSQPASAAVLVPDLDHLPGLSSSQESIESTDPLATPMVSNTRKRVYADEVEHVDGVGGVGPGAWCLHVHDGEVSPRSQTPVAYGGGRVMAVPRGRRHIRAEGGTAGRVSEQANMRVVVAGSDDFPEADFLEYTPEMDTDAV